eukprot:g5269.t1
MTLTSADGPLTLGQRRKYEEDGFLLVRGVFAPQEVAPLHEHYVEICRDAKRYQGKTVGQLVRDINIADGTIDTSHLPAEYSIIKLNFFRGEDGEDSHFWSGYVRNKRLVPFVRQFVQAGPESGNGDGAAAVSVDHSEEDSDICTANHMYVCKPPGLAASGSTTSRHPLHQDLLYFPVGERQADGSLTAADRSGIVCAWGAVGDVERRNGCLCFIPGSHRRGLRAHSYPDEGAWGTKRNTGYFGIQDLTPEEIESRVHVEMRAGDVVFFHPETIHGSGVNKRRVEDALRGGDPSAFRPGISVHYRRKSLKHIRWDSVPRGKANMDSISGKDLLRSQIGIKTGLRTEEEAVRFIGSEKGRGIIGEAYSKVHHEYITVDL